MTQSGALELRGLTQVHAAGQPPALDDFTLDVPAGSCVAASVARCSRWRNQRNATATAADAPTTAETAMTSGYHMGPHALEAVRALPGGGRAAGRVVYAAPGWGFRRPMAEPPREANQAVGRRVRPGRRRGPPRAGAGGVGAWRVRRSAPLCCGGRAGPAPGAPTADEPTDPSRDPPPG